MGGQLAPEQLIRTWDIGARPHPDLLELFFQRGQCLLIPLLRNSEIPGLLLLCPEQFLLRGLLLPSALLICNEGIGRQSIVQPQPACQAAVLFCGAATVANNLLLQLDLLAQLLEA